MGWHGGLSTDVRAFVQVTFNTLEADGDTALRYSMHLLHCLGTEIGIGQSQETWQHYNTNYQIRAIKKHECIPYV